MTTQSFQDIDARVLALVEGARRRMREGDLIPDVAYDLAQELRNRRHYPPFMVCNLAAVAVVHVAARDLIALAGGTEKLEPVSTVDTAPAVAAVGYEHVIGASDG